ncbi:hypothetical protein FKM82_015109 [Ascaphus truei]
MYNTRVCVCLKRRRSSSRLQNEKQSAQMANAFTAREGAVQCVADPSSNGRVKCLPYYVKAGCKHTRITEWKVYLVVTWPS